MIRVGICEDEKACREVIGRLVDAYFRKKGLAYEKKEYESGQSFLAQGEGTDLLLLDIEMEGMSGIQLKDRLCRECGEVKIVFVTNHWEGMPEAFGKNVYGFVHKPIERARLEKYLDRVAEDLEETEGFVIKGVGREIVINIKQIYYFVAESKYSRVVSSGGVEFCGMGLGQLEGELKGRSFFRCHRCYLVNFRNICSIEGDIRMKNGDRVPVSRRKGKALRDSYREYMVRKAR